MGARLSLVSSINLSKSVQSSRVASIEPATLNLALHSASKFDQAVELRGADGPSDARSRPPAVPRWHRGRSEQGHCLRSVQRRQGGSPSLASWLYLLGKAGDRRAEIVAALVK
jgi:hypothetical protein